MFECMLCHFSCSADDIALRQGNHVICLRCKLREGGNEQHMDKRLMAELSRVVNDAPTS